MSAMNNTAYMQIPLAFLDMTDVIWISIIHMLPFCMSYFTGENKEMPTKKDVPRECLHASVLSLSSDV